MAGLKGDVKLPGVGSVPRWGVVAGAGVAAVGIILYMRNRNSSSSASSSATPASSTAATGAAFSGGEYPPDGTTGNPSDPFSTDPATGETYGNEGYASQYYDYGAGSGGGGSSPSGPPFTDNASWSQYAENYLTQTIGQDPGTVSGALGLYLSGQAVTSSQQSIIDQAIAFAGQPPVQGPGGYPPQIRVQSNTGGGTGPQTGVPSVVGKSISQAESAITTAGFTYQVTGNGSIVDSQSPAGGTAASSGTLVTLNAGGAQGEVTVPKVTGLSVADATTRLRQQSLVVGHVSKASGTVNSQTPGAGKKVAAGSSVDLGVK